RRPPPGVFFLMGRARYFPRRMGSRQLSPMPPTGAKPTLFAAYQAHAADVHRMVRGAIPEQDAADVEQQCWQGVASSLPSYDATRPLQRWITRITVYTIARYFQRGRVRSVVVLDALIDEWARDRRSSDEDRLGAKVLLDEVLRALSPRQREAVI